MTRREPLVLLVIVSLLVNLYAVSRINSLESTISEMRSAVMSQSNQGQLQSQISALSDQIARMEFDTSWIVQSSVNPVLQESTREHIYLSIEWVMREVKTGSQVSLLYKSSDEEVWTRAENVKRDQNSFSAKIEVQPRPGAGYQYRFEEQTSTATQTSEIYSIDNWLHNPTSYIFFMGSTNQAIKKGFSILHFNLFAQSKSPFDFYQISELKANYYSAGVQVKSEIMRQEDSERGYYSPQLEIPSNIDTVKLEAVFADGHKVEETIWPQVGDKNQERLLFGR